MLDYLSQFPGFTKEQAINYVRRELKDDFNNVKLDEKNIISIISSEYDKIDGRGSHSAWMTIIGPLLIKNVKKCLSTYQASDMDSNIYIVENPNNVYMLGFIKK